MNRRSPAGAGSSEATIAEAVLFACLSELDALKPGNVGLHRAGHGMCGEDFVRSAEAIAPVLAMPALSVGQRVLGAIQATRRVVDCNTNLGIVLLCAPLSHAAAHARPGQSLRSALHRTLQGLDVHDAQLSYAAIRLAQPGGLGTVPEYDVSASHQPRVSLLQAMRVAAGRDRIARQYVSDYTDVFEMAVPRLRAWLARRGSREWATVATYLELLAVIPDTHIERKFGARTAREVSVEAARLNAVLSGDTKPEQLRARLSRFDNALKQKGINPGTTADLTVAALMVQYLQDQAQTTGPKPSRGKEPARGAVSGPWISTAT
jgi:triphosphoribosyl-dephospho-CoA synthase